MGALCDSGTAESPDDAINLPVCVNNNLLDKREYLYDKSNGIFYNSVGTDSTIKPAAAHDGPHSCRLLKYTAELAVTCIDTLYQDHVIVRNQANNNANQTIIPTEMQFVFMGDSRIRQQFFNFLELIPDYDRQTFPAYNQKNENTVNHGDLDWCSSMLKLRVSYKWRPLIDDNVMEMVGQWAEQPQKPYLIFLSLGSHHMLADNGNDHRLFRKKLSQLGKTLGQLAESSQVIWLNQYPMVELYGPTLGHNTDIHSAKVHQYNEVSRQTLQNYSGIRIWDSGNPLAEEYIRSCVIFPERDEHRTFYFKSDQLFNPIIRRPYFSCLDVIHTGSVALAYATQILYNDICNTKMTAESPDEDPIELPVCVNNNLLDKREYLYDKSNGIFYNTVGTDSTIKPAAAHSCRLVKYTAELAVTCIDTLYQDHVIVRNQANNNANQTIIPTEMQFVFMGDSRIRQQYFNFLQLIPDYDRQTHPAYIQKNENSFNHGDVDWCSNMLKLRVSYKWRPLINDNVMEMVGQWADQPQKPYLIFLSMETHHMLVRNGNDHRLFRKKLSQLGTILGQLAESSQVIWLNQYPIVELYGPTLGHNTDIHSAKVHQYNEVSRQTLQNYSGIRIWDSGNPLAEEYIRSCVIFPERDERRTFYLESDKPFNPITSKPYVNCLDFIHTGSVALAQATQILYNDICNTKMYSGNVQQ
ncbi:hypothetical protein DAPPUDRAFT_330622 [Daphnia pulex]|uniref:Uncharacterized protein n=1 Tax=Daphnia pulex TaxID=6669 RepID=E9HK47_DAPPU|nr:hypothetical protein DAPPUDRAFT_330622 [Daphnia pulex]|eukprot:EFX67818.1 hypothetical protein DAPPUDRAFT_330622 [Daphnia pulex]